MLPSSLSVAMAGQNKPQRFKLSLPFMNRKKERKNRQNLSASEPDCCGVPDLSLGDTQTLHGIAEENEDDLPDILHVKYSGSCDENVDEFNEEHDSTCHDDESLHLVPKTMCPHDVNYLQSPRKNKTFDISYTAVSPQGRRKSRGKVASPGKYDSAEKSGPVRGENNHQVSTDVGCKSFFSSGCGQGVCSKQIDAERDPQRRRSSTGDRPDPRRRQSRPSVKEPLAWETEESWNSFPDIDEENAIIRKNKAASRKKGQKKTSNHIAPSPGFSPKPSLISQPLIDFPLEKIRKSCSLHPHIASMRCSPRDADMKYYSSWDGYEESRRSKEFERRPQRQDERKSLEMVRLEEDHTLSTSSEIEGNGPDEHSRPWERSYSTPNSDGGLFTTSFEVEVHGKVSRRNKWSSNSSEETEEGDRHPTSRGRLKNNWNRDCSENLRYEDACIKNQTTRGQKGSRIIFLSTPPRKEHSGEDTCSDHDPLVKSSNDRSAENFKLEAALVNSIDRSGEYCKLETGSKEPRFEKNFPTSYKAKIAPSLFEGDLEANAKAWQELDLRSMRGDVDSDPSNMEFPLVPRSREPGKGGSRHIEGQLDDQVCSLRLESDSSDSSEGTPFSYKPSRRYKSGQFDQDKPARRKRAGHPRRRRVRKNKHAPPLPVDLHGKVKESVAVVKSSYDPYHDFRDSMVEMIIEKEIQGAADLEELLRCYLSLNAAEYHSVIVKVFADVWRELFHESKSLG